MQVATSKAHVDRLSSYLTGAYLTGVIYFHPLVVSISKAISFCSVIERVCKTIIVENVYVNWIIFTQDHYGRILYVLELIMLIIMKFISS